MSERQHGADLPRTAAGEVLAGAVIWCLGYCLAVYIPIGYVLQEGDKAKPVVEAKR